MKWIATSPGRYQLVPDDDPRPAVDLPNREGAPAIHVSPPWAVHEAAAHSDNPNEQVQGTDRFLAERAKAVRHSQKWARYERSRKATLEKDRPAWIKKRKEAHAKS